MAGQRGNIHDSEEIKWMNVKMTGKDYIGVFSW
jgi:hypothetical protein